MAGEAEVRRSDYGRRRRYAIAAAIAFGPTLTYYAILELVAIFLGEGIDRYGILLGLFSYVVIGLSLFSALVYLAATEHDPPRP